MGKMPAVGSLLLGIRVALAAVFAVAGAAKLLDTEGSRRSLAEFGVPTRALPTVAILLPLLELATAIALIPPATARWGALAALGLVLSFIGGIANALRHGQAPDCHCFGQVYSAPAGRSALARNAVLAGLAAFVVWRGPGPSISAWVSARTPAELAAVAAVAAALGLGVIAWRLWRERNGLRDALAGANAEIAALPAGLPVGATAPGFALPDLRGETRTLESLRAEGRPIALVFISPGCGPCHEMLPDLGRWQAALADRLTVAVISRGEALLSQPAAEEHGLVNVLLQSGEQEVASAYRIRETPSAVLVTPDGAIGSSVVASITLIEPLIRVAIRRDPSARVAIPAAGALPPTT
jgi:uncharacterized membrane protein YphA (DoxX/SURF4 family)/peroxiredoxin